MYKTKQKFFKTEAAALVKPVVESIEWYGAHTQLVRYSMDTNALTRCLRLAAGNMGSRIREMTDKNISSSAVNQAKSDTFATRIRRYIDLKASLKMLSKPQFDLLVGDHLPETYRSGIFADTVWQPVQDEFFAMQRDGKPETTDIRFYILARAAMNSFVSHLLHEFLRPPKPHQPRHPYDRARIKTMADGRKFYLEFKSLN
jgi:hypothetical protein